MRTSVRRTTASSQTTIGTPRTPTSRPQSRTPMTTLTSTDAWRTESARTAHLFHSCMAQVLSAFTLHPWSSTWRTLLDSTSPFFLYFSFLSFSVYFLHHELFLELDNPIVMASLCYSAAEESEDTLNASHSLTCYEPNLLTVGELNDSSVPFSFMIPSSDQDIDDTRRDAHRGTPRTSRLLRTRRHVSQSVVVCNVRWIRAT